MTSPRRTSCRIFAIRGPGKRLNRSLPREASGDDPRGRAVGVVRRRLWVDSRGSIRIPRTAEIGASRPFPWVPAKIGLPKRERMLGGVVGNAFSCPFAALHDGHEDRRSWVDSSHLLSELTKTGQRRAQRCKGHLKDPFERPIEFQNQEDRTGDR